MEQSATMAAFAKPKLAAVAVAAGPAAAAEKPSLKVSAWKSVEDPVQDQAMQVVEWAKEAKEAAAKAGVDVKKVAEAGNKAQGSMSAVLAEVGNAKAAMDKAISSEQKIHGLYDRVYAKAHEVAIAEVRKILPELRKKAQDKADEKAEKKAKVVGKQMKAKAREEGAKAAKVFTDHMDAASKNAAAYAKLGDTLIGQSANMQMQAGFSQNQANQYSSIGQISDAQKLYQQSRFDMNTALSLNSQATKMYDTANSITAQLPAFSGQAAMAAYHAQTMYDPDAQPPPPPLVLAQQHQSSHHVRGSLHSQKTK
jgi:hypothetical protein